ncbi:MAG TPA: DUF1549 domain-containing protein [Acidobacteriota bacterium]|jgi:hypothetical protein|nr:DUF1549 domain-containing protein [Acidobacteriota bacterium]
MRANRAFFASLSILLSIPLFGSMDKPARAGSSLSSNRDATQSNRRPAVKRAANSEHSRIAATKPGLDIQPSDIVFTSPREIRRVLVTARSADGTTQDITGSAQLKTSSDAVQIDKGGLMSPVKDGTARIDVSANGMTTSFTVTVRGLSENQPVGFVKDVMPILGRAGCNSGVCHGAAKGKAGFKLSLRGYDARFDYAMLVNDLWGRRFNRADPAQSLILLKPTTIVAHGGGLRFPAISSYYDTIAAWIAQGAKFNDEKTGLVSKLEVIPSEILMHKPGLAQQMLVLAHYPDGSTRDVTLESVFTSSASTIAEVSDSGLVKSLRKGESVILVRYQGQFASVPVTALTEKTGFQWVRLPQHNFIDKLIDAKLKRLKILPSPLCTDAEFVRRVYLDLTGLIPRPEEVSVFLDDPEDGHTKRSRLINQLLDSNEYVDYWSLKWGDLLQCNRRFLTEKGVWSYRNWIRQSVARNKPYDQFVREIIIAGGSTFTNPPANFYRVTKEPKVAMETASQLFMGVRMMCAQCHDHPFEPWTQKNYYEMAAFFGGIAIKEGAGSGEAVVYEKRDGYEIRHPKYGYVVPANFPFAPAHVNPEENRRRQFAGWLTSKENPYFSVAIANRLWSYFFGRGIIDPVDDLRPSNPSSNPALLSALANEVQKSNFDLKQLMRTVVNSRTYQSSYRVNEWNADDENNFSHQRPRRLTAEQLLDAVAVATGSKVKFEGVPENFRAEQLPDPRVDMGGFLDLFGRPARESPCECERRGDISLGQALNLVNGGTLADAIADRQGRVAKLILAEADDVAIVRDLYLATFGRRPDAPELRRAGDYLKAGNNRAERAQDILWALLNSPAFLFNK